MGLSICCVPSMALILLVKVQSRVFAAKCSESQVGIGNGMDEGSGVSGVQILTVYVMVLFLTYPDKVSHLPWKSA